MTNVHTKRGNEDINKDERRFITTDETRIRTCYLNVMTQALLTVKTWNLTNFDNKLPRANPYLDK